MDIASGDMVCVMGAGGKATLMEAAHPGDAG